MQTTPETAALFGELYEQASIVAELDGPQLEAWVSGLFPVFDDQLTPLAFVEHCAGAESERGALLVAAIAELTTGLDRATADYASGQDRGLLPAWAALIGRSRLQDAWSVTAKFGASIVLGFDVEPDAKQDNGDDAPDDLRHSILVELGDDGALVDLQLTGPAQLLVDEAADEADRVVVAPMELDEAVAAVIAAWPSAEVSATTLGTGFDANQQFVRRRMLAAGSPALPHVVITQQPVDVRRGMNDAEYAEANRAALSTLQAAVGLPEGAPVEPTLVARAGVWAAIVRGDVDDVSPRERDALLWLEWADWLGAGIGLLRAGADTASDGSTLVDHVNRCPEVSSSIDKADRDYAEWAFDVALDLLQDQGLVTDGRLLTSEGHASLRHGLVAAWS